MAHSKHKVKAKQLTAQLRKEVELETALQVMLERYQENRDTMVRYAEALGRVMATGRILCDQFNEVYPEIDESGLDPQLVAYIKGFRACVYGLIPREKRTKEENEQAGYRTGPPGEEKEGVEGEVAGEAQGVVEGEEGEAEAPPEAPGDPGEGA